MCWRLDRITPPSAIHSAVEALPPHSCSLAGQSKAPAQEGGKFCILQYPSLIRTSNLWPSHTEPPGIWAAVAVSKDPEGNVQPGDREKACTGSKAGKRQQMLNALLGKGQLQPRAWWTLELSADSGGHNDIFQTVSYWPSSWVKNAAEQLSVWVCIGICACEHAFIPAVPSAWNTLSNCLKPSSLVSTWSNPRHASRLSSNVWCGLRPDTSLPPRQNESFTPSLDPPYDLALTPPIRIVGCAASNSGLCRPWGQGLWHSSSLVGIV